MRENQKQIPQKTRKPIKVVAEAGNHEAMERASSFPNAPEKMASATPVRLSPTIKPEANMVPTLVSCSVAGSVCVPEEDTVCAWFFAMRRFRSQPMIAPTASVTLTEGGR